MITYDCDCKDVVITEGIFGEICAESVKDKASDYNSTEYYGEELSSDIDVKRASREPQMVPVKSYTITNGNRIEITVIAWGATIVSLKFPDKYGYIADVVLGFDDLESYMNPSINPFIGCILGRSANRIRNGYFVIKGKPYQLTINDFNKHHLHGGTKGFGRRLWESHIDDCSVVMSYLSEDGEEGYPGAVLTTVRFTLTSDNKLEISIRATTTNSTIVNISHGSLFNLAGHPENDVILVSCIDQNHETNMFLHIMQDTGKKELLKHRISLNCDRWTFADYTDPVPTGGIRGVGGTIMDLRVPKLLESCIEKVPPGEGYDHNFCVTPNWHGGSAYVARAVHPRSGRVLEVYSNQPGVQFYTGGRLSECTEASSDITDTRADDDKPDDEEEYEEKTLTSEQTKPNATSESKSSNFIIGKKGARYEKHCAFSIQPQNYPNAINYPHFPQSVLRPGQVYCHDITYKFGIQLANYM